MDLHRHRHRLRAIIYIHARRVAVEPVVEQLGGGLSLTTCSKKVNSISADGLMRWGGGVGVGGKDGLSGERQASAWSGARSGRRGVQRHFMINQQIIFLYHLFIIKYSQ
jgi:hypothetical protein